MKNKKEYCKTIKLIKKTYNINRSIPKGWGTYSINYSKYYKQKNLLIKKIIENIKNYQLKIKYGTNINKYGGCDIIYFCFDGCQFSFHGDFWGYNIKKYKGNWQGTRRKKPQFNQNNKIIGLKNCYKRW